MSEVRLSSLKPDNSVLAMRVLYGGLAFLLLGAVVYPIVANELSPSISLHNGSRRDILMYVILRSRTRKDLIDVPPGATRYLLSNTDVSHCEIGIFDPDTRRDLETLPVRMSDRQPNGNYIVEYMQR